MPAEQLSVRRVFCVLIESLNDVKYICDGMKKCPNY